MKICSISDLHGNLIYYPSDYWKELWECEVLFICGDILPLQIQANSRKSLAWLKKDFIPWAESLPVEQIFLIAGNHDFWFERHNKEAHQLFPVNSKITYIKNETVEYTSIQDGNHYRIFGTPYCNIYGNWPFMQPEEVLEQKFSEIPENIDILFTHDAPYGTSDICFQGWSADGEHKGCPALRNAILEKKPKYNFHGHLHSSNHAEEMLGETKVFNTSILDEEYKPTYYPLIIRI
jgi:Icc-related predicted phosphoesterase